MLFMQRGFNVKISEILRLSAKSVAERSQFSCHAIRDVAYRAGENAAAAKQYYIALMKPEPNEFPYGCPQLDIAAWLSVYCDDRDQQLRVMALLFAAECAESDGL